MNIISLFDLIVTFWRYSVICGRNLATKGVNFNLFTMYSQNFKISVKLQSAKPNTLRNDVDV